MSKNIWYDNQQMTTRIKIVLVAAIALMAIGITNTGEIKIMGLSLNPANWQIIDTLQGQQGGYDLNPLDNGGNIFTGTQYSLPGSTSSVTTQPNIMNVAAGAANNLVGTGIQDRQDLQNFTPADTTGQTGPQVTAVLDANTAAQQAQAAAQASARNSFNQGRSDILSNIRNAATNYAQTGTNNILDFIEGLKSQQQGLDIRRANAVLGQRNAAKNIMGMVGQGIRSFGVNLANRNAGDSSAALAGAQAYGRMGNQQMQDVNQQFGLENANIDVAQQGLNTDRESGRRRLETEKAQKINELTNYAQQKFAALNAEAEDAGIMDRIAIEQEKENIKNELIQSLAALDAQLGQANTVNPMDQMGVQNKAQELSQLGQGGTQFDFTTTTPTQLQTGAQLGQLPIFSNRRKRA